MTMIREVIQDFKHQASKDRIFLFEEMTNIKEYRDTMKQEMRGMITNQKTDILEERSRSEESGR